MKIKNETPFHKSDTTILPIDTTSGQNDNHIRFIDKFIMPENAEKEFVAVMNINREFISNLPGFIEDAVYKSTVENGYIIYITVAVWENEEKLHDAKKAVQKKYEKEGIDPKEMLDRLNISIERGVFTKE